MSVLTSPQQAEFEKAATRVVHYVSFDFVGGISRLSTFNIPDNWGGYDWSPLGGLLGMSDIEESEGTVPRPVSFTIPAADMSWLALAVGPAEEYLGRAATVWICPLDESFTKVGTPAIAWRGIMNMVVVGVQGGVGGIVIRCETAAYALKRRPTYRINAAQHKRIYPTETGMDRLNDLIANPQLWISKKFQAV